MSIDVGPQLLMKWLNGQSGSKSARLSIRLFYLPDCSVGEACTFWLATVWPALPVDLRGGKFLIHEQTRSEKPKHAQNTCCDCLILFELRCYL